jgi:hypothetical protein
VQDGDDADGAVAEQLPVDDVAFVAAEVTVDAELGRDGPPGKTPRGDGFEPVEQAPDIALGLGLARCPARVGVDLIQPVAGVGLDPERAHGFRAITVSASRAA